MDRADVINDIRKLKTVIDSLQDRIKELKEEYKITEMDLMEGD